ncbi:HNH endonuclease [Phycisphaeraceae bacterium D3-23]
MDATASALNEHVLVLNKMWMAVRVIDARRAFAMLLSGLAEAIRVDDGSYTGYDFADWTDLSLAQRRLFPEPTRGPLPGEPTPDSTPDATMPAVDDPYAFVRTVRMHLAVPKVIRLLGYDKLPRTGVKLNRRNIFARDHNHCQYCRRKFPMTDLSLDHVVPRSQGGGTSWENLVCCCVKCNTKKGGRTPKQAQMPLAQKPVKPKTNPVLSIRIGKGKYKSWKAFLDNAYWSVELK